MSVEQSEAGEVFGCPCCGYKTIAEPGCFEICAVCFWEDDGQGDADADIARGGPNGVLSLSGARANFKLYGASDPKFIGSVRKPLPDEV
jgi:hypothetical protein